MPSVHLRIEEERAGYIRSISPFALSIFLHVAAVFALVAITKFGLPDEMQALRPPEELLRVTPKQVIYYRFPKRLPDVSPAKEIGLSVVPQGAEYHPHQTIIAQPPNAPRRDQLVYRPEKPVPPPVAVPAPNIIAVREPPKAAKLYTPPPAPRPAETSQPVLKAPELGGASGVSKLPGLGETLQKSLAVKPAPKAFVPPPKQAAPKLPVAAVGPPPTLVASNAPAAIGKGEVLKELSQGPAMAKPKPKAFVPPTAGNGTGQGTSRDSKSAGTDFQAPPSISSVNGPAANLDLAIIGLNPAAELQKLPEGSQPAAFSRAPVVGPPASGKTDGKEGLTVPNVLIRDRRPETDAPLPIPAQHKEIEAAPLPATFSVPMRPNSRLVPFAIERRFSGRAVYTIVIPKPKIPIYAADWILWFAEVGAKTGSLVPLKAPLPWKKIVPLDEKPLPDSPTVDSRLQLGALINRDGLIQSVSIITGGTPSMNQAVLQDVRRWIFRPATREGVPVEVEVVLEIAFRFPQSVVLQ